TRGKFFKPFNKIHAQVNFALCVQQKRLPGANGREPDFIRGVPQLTQCSRAEEVRFPQAPQPDVSIEEELQSRRTSHSSSSAAGEIMSPRISIRPFMEPIQAERSSTGDGGTTSATGLPWRVMRRGFLVLLTCSSNARHLALNSEIDTSCMLNHLVRIIDHGQINSQFLQILEKAPKLSSPGFFELVHGLAGCGQLLGEAWRFRPGLFL